MVVETLTLYENKKIEIVLPERPEPEQPLFILAHGAGNDMHSPFIKTVSDGLQQRQVTVLRFNFPYKTEGKQLPDRSEVLEDSWKRVITWVEANMKYRGLFIGGKSMGGRIAAMIAGEFPQVAGLIFLGYPLHAPGKYDEIRDDYLYPLPQPMLFVQGTRDGFARMDLLQSTLNGLRDRARLHWVEGGDHSFKVLVRQGISYPETLSKVAEVVAGWIHQQAPAAP